jgi:hypothetical protein
MSQISRFKLARWVASMIIGSIILIVANSGTALAGYGPPAPQALAVVPVTGGYYCVVTSQTVGPPGKFIGTLKLHGKLAVTLGIQQGIFPVFVQVTITEPYGQDGNCQGNTDIGCIGFAGYQAVGGVGIIVQSGGSAYAGKFGRPLALRLASPLISTSSLLVVWNGQKFVKAPGAIVRSQAATVAVKASSDYAVLVPDKDSCLQDASATAAAAVAPGTAGDALAAIFFGPASSPLPGFGVLLPAR